MTIVRDQTALEIVKAELLRRGYRIETDAEGNVRIVRPDGTVAITAKKPMDA